MRKLPIFWHLILGVHILAVVAATTVLYEKTRRSSQAIHALERSVAEKSAQVVERDKKLAIQEKTILELTTKTQPNKFKNGNTK